MYARLLVICTCLAACASSGEEPPAASGAQERMSITNDRGGLQMDVRLDNVTTRDQALFRAPVDAVWAVLPAVLDSVGVPVAQLDQANRTIGNPSVHVRRQLGGVRFSRYFNCGSTQGGPNADTYEVQLSVTARVLQAGSDTTRVSMLLDAQAKPMATTGGWVRCTATGTLQSRIFELIDRHLVR